MAELSKKIMRRVYYAFFLRQATHPFAVHGAIIALCLLALARAVSIPNVWANMMEVKVGELVGFWTGALIGTEIWTILLLAATSIASVSLIWRLLSGRGRFDLDMVKGRRLA